jgi:hypothetical protein
MTRRAAGRDRSAPSLHFHPIGRRPNKIELDDDVLVQLIAANNAARRRSERIGIVGENRRFDN